MSDTAADGSPAIELDDEIEGNEVGSRNYRFAKIGEPVPINSDAAPRFDSGCLPSRPLVVSERFRLLFVAHPQGFYVTRTKDIMASAEAIKEKEAGKSVQELSLVEISLGKISVLALSADDSVLAACMDNCVHFFAVSALLHKEKKPSYSVSVDEPGHIKDFCWSRKVAKVYIILAANGKLYNGSGQGPPSYVMEDVDAVDWSVKGNFVAVARKNRLSILSSQFKEKLSFLLQSQSVTGGSDGNQARKVSVDSVRWVRSDCIAVGCFLINEDGEEEHYVVQVITTKGRRITDVTESSKPTVLSFSNIFMDLSLDAVPTKCGPHLFLSYLGPCGLAFVATRNLSCHVGLFHWSVDNGENELSMVEILNDAWNLYIDSQDDGEENVLVGLSVDKVSQKENVTFTLGDEETEASPCCIIICLTIDGNISVFHFASAAGALVSSKAWTSDEEDDNSQTSAKPEVNLISSADDGKNREPTLTVTETEAVKTAAEASVPKNLSSSSHVDVRSQEQIINPRTLPVSEPKETLEKNKEKGPVSEAKFGIGSSPGQVGGDISHLSASQHLMLSTNMEPLSKVPQTSSGSALSSTKSNARLDDSKSSTLRFISQPNVVDTSTKSALTVTETEAVNTAAEASVPKNLSSSSHVDVRSQEQIINPRTLPVSEPKETLEKNKEKGPVSEAKFGIGSSPGQVGGDISHLSASQHLMLSTNMEPLSKVPQTSSGSALSSTKSNARLDDSKSSTLRFISQPNVVDTSTKSALQSAGGASRHPTDLKEKEKSFVPFSSYGQTLPTGLGSRNSVPAYPVTHPNVVDASNKNAFQSAGGASRHPTDLKEKETSSPFSSFGQTLPTGQGNRNPVYPVSSVPIGGSAASGKPSVPEHRKGFNVPSSSMGQPSFSRTTSKQFGNVEEMAKNLDSLLEGIEEKGGFRDASITSQIERLAALEEDIWAFSNKCRVWRGLMDKQLREVQLLFDKMIQVSVRKVYVEAIFKQAKDSRYWELWNRQKLSSELELKQRRILQLNQELTNKLIELERHFNSLEFNKFGENGGMRNDRRVLQNSQGPSRKIQSLQSLHKTIQAQLTAAEQLSGCLSDQMSALSIESSGKEDLKKQLFECIGLSYGGETPRSLARVRTFETPSKIEHSAASGTFSSKEKSQRNHATFVKNDEPETARRRRESLDHSWASFDPPKTTVKRILKGSSEKGSASQSFSNISKPHFSSQAQNVSEVAQSAFVNISGASGNSNKTKGTTEMSSEPPGKNSATSQKTAGLIGPGLQVTSSKLQTSMLETRITGNRELGGALKLFDEKPKSSLAFPGKTDFFAGSPSTVVQKSDSSFNASPSISKQLTENLMNPPSGSTENVDRSKFGAWDQKNSLVASEAPAFGSKSPITSASASSSGFNVFEKGSFTGTAEKASSKSNDGLTASTSLQSVISPTLVSSSNIPSVSSSVSKPSSSTLFPATPSPGASVNPRQAASQPLGSVPSALSFPFPSPFSTHPSSPPSASLSSGVNKSESATSVTKPPVGMSGAKTDDASHKVTQVVNMSLKPGQDANIQAPTSQPGESASQSSLKLGLPVPSSTPAAVLDLNSVSSTVVSSSSKSSPVVTPDTKLELPQTTEPLPQISQPTEGVVGSMKNAITDVSNEEEMDEEAPESQQATEFSIGSLDGFGLGTTLNPSVPKSNPFGVGILKQDSSIVTPPLMPSSSGGLFRPASFNIQSPQPPNPSNSPVSFSGGFGSGNSGQVSAAAGFGQPAHVGAGQQALGSLLGSFGQSRQFGSALPGSNVASASSFGSGFAGSSGSAFGGGFTSAPSVGGFASLASGAGGFAAAAGGGGGGGFAAASGGGGFGAFGTQQPSGGGGFAAFGGGNGGTGIAKPSSSLFTQMRK
ncbi:nuclear pore complex protein NUP214 [Andrographis paniculata]|uniref:nuclear pore complex protein NUP214 n=1 Tax=Andrographis paniculata TaxID=175694 RepID=UPI0021E7B76B|nr:nuclear pore complex protein NUP214 [Andrographis paniculata]